MNTHQRVLVAEAAPFMRKAFIKALLRQRCRPITTSEVIEQDGVLCLKRDHGVEPLPKDIDVALVDCMTDKSVTGAQLIRELTARGIPCIGIAAFKDFNKPLKQAGAKFALCKNVALPAIYSGALPLEQARNMSRESLKRLAKFRRSHRNNKRLKSRISSLLEKCMQA